MKAYVILISAGIAYGTVQLTNCKTRQPVISQRYVQVIEVSANHPPKYYVVSEPAE
jgi:hypothetical protein